MPALLINIVNGQWVALIANTNIRYVFAGKDLEDQQQVVRGFAETMADNNPNVVDFFTDAQLPPQEFAQQLFGTTDSLVYAGNPIYTVGDDFLLDDLEGAGEVLLEFVV